jgi:hypothetical protein
MKRLIAIFFLLATVSIAGAFGWGDGARSYQLQTSFPSTSATNPPSAKAVSDALDTKGAAGSVSFANISTAVRSPLAGKAALAGSASQAFAGLSFTGPTAGHQTSIGDDAVASFTPFYNRGFLVVASVDYGENMLFSYYKLGALCFIRPVAGTTNFTVTYSTTLVGTTGTDGKVNLSYNAGVIYIENRLGGASFFHYAEFGGTME